MDESLRTVGTAGRTSPSPRTLVIGLSGCSWNVLEPLLESGELPNLAALRDGGASGTLRSVVPFHHAPAWASYATGVSPGAHGCLDLVAPDAVGRLRVVRGSDLRSQTYFEQLGRDGRRSVLVNLPIDQSGCEGAVIVNSWLTLDEGRRIFPVGRRERYRRLLDAQRLLPSNPHDLDEICAIDEARFDLVRELCLYEEWDHFFVLFSSTDWLGHAATGRFLRGDEDARKAFLRLYRQLDTHIGWLLRHADDATAIVLSEHGQAEELAVLRVNTVLDRLGLVETLPEGSVKLPARTRTVPSVLSRYRGNAVVRPVALAAKAAARHLLGVQLVAPSQRIDTTRSRAYSPTDASFAVYLRDEDRLDEVVEALASLTLVDRSPAIDAVWKTAELWGRTPAAGEPTLLFAPAPGVRPVTAIKDRAVDFPSSHDLGCHQRDGVLLLGGPGVHGGSLGPVDITDLAPTLLWLADAPLPAPTEGRVLEEAFRQAPANGRPARAACEPMFDHATAANGDHDTVTRRLKALGYI